MSVGYAREKLYLAVSNLVGAGSIQDRLASAARNLVVLTANDFPEDERSEFTSIRHALTYHLAERVGEGAIDASTRHLTPEAGEEISRKIVGIYHRLHRSI